MAIRVTGLKGAQDKLRSMAEKTAKQYVRKALREGAKAVLSQAKADAPAKTGLVRRSLRISGGRGSKSKIALRISMGKKMFSGKEFYGAFVELGHFTGKRPAIKDARRRKLASLSGRRFIPGQHFLQRAFDSKKEQSIQIFIDKLWQLIRADL